MISLNWENTSPLGSDAWSRLCPWLLVVDHLSWVTYPCSPVGDHISWITPAWPLVLGHLWFRRLRYGHGAPDRRYTQILKRCEQIWTTIYRKMISGIRIKVPSPDILTKYRNKSLKIGVIFTQGYLLYLLYITLVTVSWPLPPTDDKWFFNFFKK